MYIFQTNQTEATMNNQFQCHLQRYLFSLFQLSGDTCQKLLNHLYTENVIIVYKIYFLSVLSRCWSKREHFFLQVYFARSNGY